MTKPHLERQWVYVAVGIIINTENKILLSEYQKNKSDQPLWEFPGGKLEIGESSYQGLKREFKEELGIIVNQATPLMSIGHQYSDTMVRLSFWHINSWNISQSLDNLVGLEGQAIRWLDYQQFKNIKLHKANQVMIDNLTTLIPQLEN